MWNRVGTIGVTHAVQERFAAVQEQSAVQEQMGLGAQKKFTTKYPYPPRGTPGFGMPGDLAARLRQVPGEVFDIFPGFPNTTVSSLLSVNTVQVQTAIHTFTPPTGHYIVLDPGDVTQEVLLQPYSSQGQASSNFIRGLIEIFTRTGLIGKSERVYAGGAEFHRPESNLSSIGHRRKWQLGYVVSPGDTLITFLTTQGSSASDVIGTAQTVLDHRVLSKKITP